MSIETAVAFAIALADAEAAAMRERAAKCVEGIGEAYGEDETGWLDCSETAAAAIRALPTTEVGNADRT